MHTIALKIHVEKTSRIPIYDNIEERIVGVAVVIAHPSHSCLVIGQGLRYPV